MGIKTLVCTAELDEAGDCPTTAQTWVELPQPPFPALTAEEGAIISFAIVTVWSLGLYARVLIRAANAAEKD